MFLVVVVAAGAGGRGRGACAGNVVRSWRAGTAGVGTGATAGGGGGVVLGRLGATEHPPLIMKSQVSSIHLSTGARWGFRTLWQPQGSWTGHTVAEALRTESP